MTIWVNVDCGVSGYQRELWIRRWRETIEYFYNAKPVYDWNGPVVYWAFHDEELGKTMTDIWSLEREGYRTSYGGKVRTFFWVDDKYYKENRREIVQWGKRYGCNIPSKEYGWIEMPDERVELLFRMVWAGKCYG